MAENVPSGAAPREGGRLESGDLGINRRYSDEEELVLSVGRELLRRSKEIAVLVVVLMVGLYSYSAYQSGRQEASMEATRRVALVSERWKALQDAPSEKQEEAKQKFEESLKLLSDTEAAPFSDIAAVYKQLSKQKVSGGDDGESPKPLPVEKPGDISSKFLKELAQLTTLRRQLDALPLEGGQEKRAELVKQLATLSRESDIVAPVAARSLRVLASTEEERAQAQRVMEELENRLPVHRDLLQ